MNEYGGLSPSGILLRGKKEKEKRSKDKGRMHAKYKTHAKNMNESHTHYTKGKKQDIKEYTLYDYMIF